jgi:hypothetical protein
MYEQDTEDDPFNDLSAAISEAENSSNIFKKSSKPPSSSSSSVSNNNNNNNAAAAALPKQTTSQSLHGALAKLSRTDEESRHFMEEEVPDHLKDFIEAPTFSSLNSFDVEDSRKSSVTDPFGSFTLQPSQPSQYNDPFAFNDSIDNIQQVNTPQNKSPEQYIQQARSKREAESNQLDQQKNNMIVDTSYNSQSSSMNQPQQQPQPQPQPQNPSTINNSPLTSPPPNPQPLTHLSPEYDAQAQQAAYFAMQAQLEQGVVFNSEDDQQAAYQSYYIYYSQYYLQIQQQAQSQEHQEYYDRAHVETQAMIDQLTLRAQEAEANLNKCQQELLLANQKLASSGSIEVANNEKYKELEASRKELNDLRVKEKQFQSMYGELESWKAKCEQLTLQLVSAAKNNTLG